MCMNNTVVIVGSGECEEVEEVIGGINGDGQRPDLEY